jgi:hypothetical protein
MKQIIEEGVQQPVGEEPKTSYQHVCGYCGSTNPLVPFEQMYGPGAVGYDCCPDCGGV